MDDLHEPPHDEAAEREVLGAIMLSPDALSHLLAECPPDAFYSPRNADIARALCSLVARREGIDLKSVWRELVAMKRANAIGSQYLGDLTDYAIVEANAPSHARHVAALAQRRALVRVLQKALARANSLAERFDDVADGVLSEVMRATERRTESEAVHMLELVVAELARLEGKGGKQPPRYPSGLADLDRLLVPMEGGQLILIGGRPSAGKTSLVLRLAQSIATLGGRVLVFSLETTDDRLARRQLAAHSVVPLRAISDAEVTQGQLNDLCAAAQKLSRLPVWVDDGYELTLSQLRAKCRRHRARFGLDAVVIDYIQLLQPEAGMGGGRAGSREQEVAALSRGLKRLAKEFNVPVLALSQLNRDSVKGGETRKPGLSDLRDSGQLEQDADAVLLAYALNPLERTRIGIVVAKQKDGPVGDAAVGFDPGRTAFRDLTESELEEAQRMAAGPTKAPLRAVAARPRATSYQQRTAGAVVAKPDDEPPLYNHETDSDFGGNDDDTSF